MSEKKQIRRYLKCVRHRMKRKQRWFLYGIILAVSLYLASIWQLRERIWSIREMDTIEYVVPEWENAAKPRNSIKIRLRVKTGELEILHERTESEGDTAGNVEK